MTGGGVDGDEVDVAVVLMGIIIVEQTTPKITLESPTESTLRRLPVQGCKPERSSER